MPPELVHKDRMHPRLDTIPKAAHHVKVRQGGGDAQEKGTRISLTPIRDFGYTSLALYRPFVVPRSHLRLLDTCRCGAWGFLPLASRRHELQSESGGKLPFPFDLGPHWPHPPEELVQSLWGIRGTWQNIDFKQHTEFDVAGLGREIIDTTAKFTRDTVEGVVGVDAHFWGPVFGRLETTFNGSDVSVMFKIIYGIGFVDP